MQTVLIIVSILMFIASIVLPVIILVRLNKIKLYHIIGVTLIVFTFFISLLCTMDKAAECNSPKAIDVYRKKTTLQITYVDTIPQDTVVVFK